MPATVELEDPIRDAVRAHDLIQAAVVVLRDAVPADGAMARCVERVGRTSRSLADENDPDRFVASIEATNEALVDVLSIGSAIRSFLDDRAVQALDSLMPARRILGDLRAYY